MEILEDANFTKVQEDLSTHVYLIDEFIDSLGLSRIARKDVALAEIERILVDAARAEREKNPAIAEEFEENRLGGRYRIYRLLVKNGVDKEEIERLDTKIKEVVCWVFRNEPDLTMVRDLESFWDGKGEDGMRSREQVSHEIAEVKGDVGLEQHERGMEKDHDENMVVIEQESKMEELKESQLQQNGNKEDKKPEGERQAVEVHHEAEHGSEEEDDYVLV